MAPDVKYLSLEEVAELLGVDYQLIYRQVRKGELTAVRIGRVYRVAASDLDAYLERSKTTGSAGEHVCAACCRTYRSSESVKNECLECGAPVCLDCWARRGVRHCREHGGEPKQEG
jgi:excisionase family DNA binding protein